MCCSIDRDRESRTFTLGVKHRGDRYFTRFDLAALARGRGSVLYTLSLARGLKVRALGMPRRRRLMLSERRREESQEVDLYCVAACVHACVALFSVLDFSTDARAGAGVYIKCWFYVTRVDMG